MMSQVRFYKYQDKETYITVRTSLTTPDIRVYTPGYPGFAQSFPQEIMPETFSLPRSYKGPPLSPFDVIEIQRWIKCIKLTIQLSLLAPIHSPWHESLPEPLAQNIDLSSMAFETLA